MVWYSHLLKNFPWFVVIYTVKSFGIVNKLAVIYIHTYIHTYIHVNHGQSLQSSLALCDTVDCSLQGCDDHGILQARILEWVAMPSYRRSS